MSFLNHVRTFDSLALPNYRRLWLGQLTTSMGQGMDQTARAWLVYSLTGSAWQLGLVSALRGMPFLLFGVLAGVAADRYGRKKQLIIAQVVNAILNATLATLILTGRIEIWQVYITAFLNGTVQTFQQPARQVLINDLVGEKHLMNAISLNSAAFNVSRSIGPAVCGVLITAFAQASRPLAGVDIAYYVQAGMYGLATVWTGRIVVPRVASRVSYAVEAASQSIMSSANEGIAYIASHRLILALMVLGLAPIILGNPYTSLMPIFAITIFHGDAGTQGLLLTTAGIGAVLAALGVASLGHRQGNGKLLIVGAASFGLSLVFFSRSPALWMAMVFVFFAGLSNTSYSSQNQTIIQMLAPAELRGRVLGVYLINRGLMPIGSLLAGGLASLLGAPWAVTIMGASCLALAIVVPALVPDIWRLKFARVIEKARPQLPDE